MAEHNETGALTEAVFYILLSLYQPCHGYGIMQKTEEMSRGRVRLGPGTLYGALNTLQERKWIRPLEGESGRKKLYQITAAGQEAVERELLRLEELLENGRAVTGKAPAEVDAAPDAGRKREGGEP